MKIRTNLITIILILMTMGYASFAIGAISADEAGKLDGTVLTPIGAIKAGNKEGTIPAWTGVPIPVPRGYKPGSGTYVDPFADEKPLFSINQKNMAQYTDKLPQGVQALMKRFPDYRIDVYPTHRTTVFPQAICDGTKRCATTATYSNGGETLNNCRAGYPFPIPKDGNEAYWNHNLATTNYPAPGYTQVNDIVSYNITSTGKMSMSLGADFTYTAWFWNPAYEKDWRVMDVHANYTGPARRNGEKALITYPMDWRNKGQVTWQYLPGQRRVRLAPDLCCDTPNAGTAGASVYDDTGIFGGNPDRFTWKLLGKKEMFVVANCYKVLGYQGPPEKAFQTHFVNPDLVRWELRRVWVVEATLKPDKRHVYSKRIFYADEDYLKFQIADNFDKRGVLYRMTIGHPIYIYDRQGMWQDFHAFYDVISNSYAVNFWPRGHRGIQYPPAPSQSYFSPDSLAGGGLR